MTPKKADNAPEESVIDTSAVSASNAPAAAEKVARFHCPYRQASLIQQALTSNKMRVAFFLGAGCPLGIRVPSGDGTKPLIPDIAGLTSEVRKRVEESKQHNPAFQTVLKRLAESGKKKPNIEEVLSHIRALRDVIEGGGIDGLTSKALDELDEEICKITTDVVKERLPGDNTPYHRLATWIGGIQRAHPVEIFTSNYDLLMEQALEARRVPYFDGFVGSDSTFFDLASMEQDNLPSRWARLWKVHGSINWWRTPERNFERTGVDKKQSGSRQMIYPSHLKYDESRRLPYFAMLDRFKSFLSRGQVIVVTCGYSFSDDHLNEIIVQGLSGNPNAVCFALLHGDRANYPQAVALARKQPNLSLLAVDGSILNTVELSWHSEEKTDHIFHGVAVQTGEIKGRTTAPSESCKFLLGDFVAYGAFLMQQLEFRDGKSGVTDAK